MHRILEFKGESMTAKQWADRLGINHKLLLRRLFAGWDIGRALSEQVHSEKITRKRS